MRALIAFLLVAGLAGCGGGPDAGQLRKDTAARLAQALPPGTLALAALERRGSQSDTKAPAGETRRVVYFDAELRLERDYDFGAWDAPGVAGLISALGAGPKGIAGITTGGNKAGDVLRAHGAVLYKRESGGWALAATEGYRPAVAPAYATNAPLGAAAILDAMRKTVDAVPKDAAPAQRAAIEQELVAAHATIHARLARIMQGYSVAAGPEHGQYLRFAQALAAVGDVRVVPLITAGGDENLRLLREGKVALALSQADAALEAYEGKGRFGAEGAHSSLRAVGSLYPEAVHVIVRADSGIASLAELKGRRVAIGVPGSASRATALRVLKAHGLEVEKQDVKPLELALGDALVALRTKEADALIQIIGVPADSVRDALSEVQLRLLPLSERGVAALAGAKAGYFAYTIPRGAYATQQRDARTIATAALLLAGTELSDSEVARFTRYVFENGRDLAARGSAQGAQVSAATARQGLSVPMHGAAAKALEAR